MLAGGGHFIHNTLGKNSKTKKNRPQTFKFINFESSITLHTILKRSQINQNKNVRKFEFFQWTIFNGFALVCIVVPTHLSSYCTKFHFSKVFLSKRQWSSTKQHMLLLPCLTCFTIHNEKFHWQFHFFFFLDFLVVYRSRGGLNFFLVGGHNFFFQETYWISGREIGLKWFFTPSKLFRKLFLIKI